MAITKKDSNSEIWEANGRTYVGGVDIGPAGTKTDTTSSVALVNNAIAKNNAGIKNAIDTEKVRRKNTYNPGDSIDALANYQKQLKQQELQRARANALSSLNAEEIATNKAYTNEINKTNTNADIALKNYFENVANRGQTYSGSTAQGEIAHNIARQNNISSLQQAQASALADIARRKQLAEQGYIDDMQSASNAIDLKVLENRMEEEKNASKNALEEAKLAAEQRRKDAEFLLSVKDYNALKELGIDATNLQTEFDTGIENTKSLISSRNSSGGSSGEDTKKEDSGYKSTDASIANYVNRVLGKDLIEYNSDTKTYQLVDAIEDDRVEGGTLSSGQVYNWYKDPIIQKVLLGVYNGAISSAEGTNFLRHLGYGETDINRVKNYTFQKEGE